MSASVRAFTLIEVMAVVLILGILATATIFSLAEQVPAARRNDVLDRLAHEDALARLAVRRTGAPATLRIDLGDQQLWRVDEAASEGQASHSWRLPRGYRLDQVLRPVTSEGGTSSAALSRIDTGTADVLFNTLGCSDTYALHLICPGGNPESGPNEDSLWLVFAGLTGQKMTLKHEDEVHNLLAALGTPRPDAR
jgi:prepilin-type N-terminal cleavage/methylation domain-containing protein